jgi:hypothetical protein
MNETTKPAQTPPAPAAGSEWLRINYGLNRKVGRKMQHRNGKLRVKGEWAVFATHNRIRDLIMRKNPGWMITGYCLAEPPNTY